METEEKGEMEAIAIEVEWKANEQVQETRTNSNGFEVTTRRIH